MSRAPAEPAESIQMLTTINALAICYAIVLNERLQWGARLAPVWYTHLGAQFSARPGFPLAAATGCLRSGSAAVGRPTRSPAPINARPLSISRSIAAIRGAEAAARKLNLHTLRFKTLLMWLTHLAEETLGIDDTVVAQRVP
jgi:hypothetical protein